MKPDGDSADAGRSNSIDPNKIPPVPPESSGWRKLLRRLSRRDSTSKLPPSPVRLTERNLTEFFNPDFNDEHDAFHRVQGPRKISIPEWIQLLP
jgi:hypothetical protein